MTEANGQAATPAAPEQQQAEQPGTAGEKVLGVIGAALGLAIFMIGVDLCTGGAISKAFGLGLVEDDSGSG